MIAHPWHEVEVGDNAPDVITSIIEIPRGSKSKYELDKKSGLLKMDRVLFSSVTYPANYGFIPRSYCEDEDPLDILVLSQVEIQPMCIVEAKVIGVMHMVDGNECDDKIIAVAAHDQSVNHLSDISELPSHTMAELKNFFEDYKKLEHKHVTVEEFKGREVAVEIVKRSFKEYQDKFSS